MIKDKKSEMVRIAVAYGHEEDQLAETLDTLRSVWNDAAGKATVRRTEYLIDDMENCRKRMTEWCG